MKGDPFADLSSGGGRFRAFLLAALKNFLANEWHRKNALKRGGSITHFPLDWESADSRFEIADHDGITPDLAFDREWALTLLEKVIGDLAAEFSAIGKSGEFAVLRAYLTAAKGEIPYDGMAEKLGIDSGALRVKIHRLRKRYRDQLKGEIARTLADPLAVDEELKVLMGAFGKGG